MLRLFAFHGIVPENRKFSQFLTVLWLTTGVGLYVWLATELELVTAGSIKTLSDVAHFILFCSVHSIEVLVLISSLSKSKCFAKLYKSLSFIDEAFEKISAIKEKTTKNA